MGRVCAGGAGKDLRRGILIARESGQRKLSKWKNLQHRAGNMGELPNRVDLGTEIGSVTLVKGTTRT